MDSSIKENEDLKAIIDVAENMIQTWQPQSVRLQDLNSSGGVRMNLLWSLIFKRLMVELGRLNEEKFKIQELEFKEFEFGMNRENKNLNKKLMTWEWKQTMSSKGSSQQSQKS